MPLVAVAGTVALGVGTIHGRSMQPTFNPDTADWRQPDRVLLEKASVRRAHYTRGDVYFVTDPREPHRTLVKRLVGLPGDHVQRRPTFRRADAVVVVPAGHAWIESDESFHGQDSTTFGPVPLGLFKSRVVWILWPLDRFGPVPYRRYDRSRIVGKEDLRMVA
ncbi:hypothetical protein CXG81DRAFT_13088 [Caulochytrium protostelioides]|uniref:Mitochondrial inner membrane protease subunit 2 n=1 Tax=Caulochytrium protostelioides TaxID=1555241 RepID=A0A4P9X5V7_9FUNG|nr:hypothetical protein CXG81DRAFT_13088 [Caulochytrium protostelioides]|eukprot:RKP00547.1 hypothetical protein CXG81DRAFT_13088 [Caulochytrium protostelioides]